MAMLITHSGEHENVFFILVDTCFFDNEIANLLKLDINEYKNTMKNKFCAYLPKNSNEIFFKDKQKAQQALEWIESLIILNKLEKNNG